MKLKPTPRPWYIRKVDCGWSINGGGIVIAFVAENAESKGFNSYHNAKLIIEKVNLKRRKTGKK